MVSLLRFGQTKVSPVEKDAEEHISLCMSILLQPSTHENTSCVLSLGGRPCCCDAASDDWLCLLSLSLSGGGESRKFFTEHCRESFSAMLKEQNGLQPKTEKVEDVAAQEADDLIAFRLLTASKAGGSGALADSEEMDSDVRKATGANEVDKFDNQLSRITQLTGFSDPLYAEATVIVHRYDIVLGTEKKHNHSAVVALCSPVNVRRYAPHSCVLCSAPHPCPCARAHTQMSW